MFGGRKLHEEKRFGCRFHHKKTHKPPHCMAMRPCHPSFPRLWISAGPPCPPFTQLSVPETRRRVSGAASSHPHGRSRCRQNAVVSAARPLCPLSPPPLQLPFWRISARVLMYVCTVLCRHSNRVRLMARKWSCEKYLLRSTGQDTAATLVESSSQANVRFIHATGASATWDSPSPVVGLGRW